MILILGINHLILYYNNLDNRINLIRHHLPLCEVRIIQVPQLDEHQDLKNYT